MIQFINNHPYWALFVLIVILVSIYDVMQTKHTIWRNFPFIGRIRWIAESIGPAIRQYFIAGDRDEAPFTRRNRGWIYASSKGENNLIGFGSDAKFAVDGYLYIQPAAIQRKIKEVPPRPLKIIGKHRTHPYHPKSFVNISAMSFGALSPVAVESLNKGAKIAGCFQNTGEGGFSKYHDHGADICFQIGTAYYGCRDEHGNFSLAKLVALVRSKPCIKLIEIKLSQGAKAGKGGMLPAEKVNEEIAEIRGIPPWTDSISPAYHEVFALTEEEEENDPETVLLHKRVQKMVDFIEMVADATGLPVGIKSAIGEMETWIELANIMKNTGKGPDFITIDGGEGGTGAAPNTFADHMGLLFFDGFPRIYNIFLRRGIADSIVWIGAGKLGLPSRAIQAFSMGIDMINVAREALFSLGCIQAMQCHKGTCPTGLTTHSKWLQRGVDPEDKSERFANYHREFVYLIMSLTHAIGNTHPSFIPMRKLEINQGGELVTLDKLYKYSLSTAERKNTLMKV